MTNPDFFETTIDGWKMRVRRPVQTSRCPVLLALHGFTGDEYSMDVFTSRLPENYWVLSLRAPFVAETGFSWVFKKGNSLPVYKDFSYATSEIVRRLETWVNKLGIVSSEIDVIGFSQGAALSLCLANDYPAIINKVAVLAGFLPETDASNPFMGRVSQKEFYVAHGTQDETIPILLARTFVNQLEEAGAIVTYCEEEVGHKLGASCFNGVRQFFSSSLGQGKQP
jgi:phospholipase/carboxylesterase